MVDEIQSDMAGLNLAQGISNGAISQRDSTATQKEVLQDDSAQQAADKGNAEAVDAKIHNDNDADVHTDGDGDGNGDGDDLDDGVQYPRLQWDSLLRLISHRIDDATEAAAAATATTATKDSPNSLSNAEIETWSLDDHDRHYRAAFDRIREEVAARDDIPDAVATAPGLSNLRLAFVPAFLAGRCPCCLVDYDFPSLTICTTNGSAGGGAPVREGEAEESQNPELQGGGREGGVGVGVGVTKDMLIQGIRDGLHPGPEESAKPEPEPDDSEEPIESEPKPKSESVPLSAVDGDPHAYLDQETGNSNNNNGGGSSSNAKKITLANFAWMNGNCGLLDDTLYVYYGNPDDDDSSSTRSELAKKGEEEEGAHQEQEQEQEDEIRGDGGDEAERGGDGADGAKEE